MKLRFFKKRPDELAFGIEPSFRRYELRLARYQEMLPVVSEVARRVKAPLRILDIGSGTGESKRFIDSLGVQTEWTGVEISPPRVEACRRCGYAEMVTDVDLEKDALPRPREAFDVVIASHVLEHLENAETALGDWYRLVRPGGALIIGVPMHLGVVAWLATLRYRLFGRRPFGHCHFFSARSLDRMLAGYPVASIAGFRVFSARKALPLEDFEWFYRASGWIGRRLPGLTAEVNVVLSKPAPGLAKAA